MSTTRLQQFLNQHHAHAALCFRLDEELGTLHGIGWADFVLLDALASAGGALPGAQLAQVLGMSRSRFLLQLIPLEKIGLVARVAGEDGIRRVVLRAGGSSQLNAARETAAHLCSEGQGSVPRAAASN